MDLFRWTYHFDVVVFSDPRMFLQILRADPDADAVIFLRGVTIGVLDPDWIFTLPSGRRHRFSTHASYILYGVWIRKVGFWILRIFLDPHMVHSDPLL